MRTTWTDERMDDFAKGVDRRFDEVNRRLDNLDDRLGKVESRLGEVAGHIEHVGQRLETIEVHLRDLNSAVIASGRAMLQFCGVMVAAQMASVATLIAIFA
jgi:archaellum component FlaC